MSITDTDVQDQADMERLMAGQDAALNVLMERHAGPIFQFIFRMLGDVDEANDLAQETFLRLYRARDRFRPGNRFTTWLFTIAANLARNHLRWRSRRPNLSLDAESSATGQTLAEVLPSNSVNPGESAELPSCTRRCAPPLPPFPKTCGSLSCCVNGKISPWRTRRRYSTRRPRPWRTASTVPGSSFASGSQK